MMENYFQKAVFLWNFRNHVTQRDIYLPGWPWRAVWTPQAQRGFILLGVGHKGIYPELCPCWGTKAAGSVSGESRQPTRPVSAKVEDRRSRKAAMPDCAEKQSVNAVSARTLGLHRWSSIESLSPAQVVDSSGFVQLGEITQTWDYHKGGECHGMYHGHRCQAAAAGWHTKPQLTTVVCMKHSMEHSNDSLPCSHLSLLMLFRQHTAGRSRNALDLC